MKKIVLVLVLLLCAVALLGAFGLRYLLVEQFYKVQAAKPAATSSTLKGADVQQIQELFKQINDVEVIVDFDSTQLDDCKIDPRTSEIGKEECQMIASDYAKGACISDTLRKKYQQSAELLQKQGFTAAVLSEHKNTHSYWCQTVPDDQLPPEYP